VRGHARTQNELANFVRRQGLVPLRPTRNTPPFDLAWERSNILYFAKVKSVTTKNEEKQLRLGLGQVLRYKHLPGLSRPSVRAVLVIERGPTDPSWFDLCRSLGVILISPDSFDRLGGS
jgi:hypothetical protein